MTNRFFVAREEEGPRIQVPLRSRRTIALSAAVGSLALVLTACSSGSDATTTTSAAPPPSDSSSAAPSTSDSSSTAIDFASYIGNPDKAICNGREYTFGYDTFSDTDAFAVALWDGLQKVASDLGCVKINKLVDNAKPDTAVQNANIFVQQGVDGAILFNVIQAASVGQAQALKGANIPLVSLAVPVDGYPFITNDDEANGLQAGTALGEAYKKTGKTEAPYAIIGRFDAQDSTKARMDGVEAGLKQVLGDVNILQIDTKADGPTTQAATTAVLAKIPAGATILLSAANDDLTYSQLQAVKQAGRQADALAMGIGGVNPVGLDYVCQNPEYVGAVGFFPETWPKFLIPALIAEINGADVPAYPDKIVVPTEVVTPENIQTFYPDFNCR